MFTKGSVRFPLIAVVLLGLSAACGGPTTGQTPSAGATSSPRAPLTKAALIAQVDAICTGVGTEMRGATPTGVVTETQVREYYSKWVVVNRAAVAKAESLGPPSSDADTWRQVIATYHSLLGSVEQNLDEIAQIVTANDTDAWNSSDVGELMQRAADESKAFGFAVCGQPLQSGESA